MIKTKKRKQTKVIYDFAYRNGDLQQQINQHIGRMENLGWNYVDIKIFIDEMQDNTTRDYLIIFQKIVTNSKL